MRPIVTVYSCAEYLQRMGYNVDPAWQPPEPPPHRATRRVTIRDIQAAVAESFDIPIEEMKSNRRAREVARPRQVAMYLSKKLTPRSLPEIGRSFGGRDHTTVIHAVRQIDKLQGGDEELRERVASLKSFLSASFLSAFNPIPVFHNRKAEPFVGKQWCGQCQRNVASAEAERCSSKFCQLARVAA